MANIYAGHYGPSGLEFPDGGHAVLHPVQVLAGHLGSSPATLYKDRYRVELDSNPVMTDSLGNLSFYAEPGRYRLVIGSYTIPVTVADDPDEPTAELTEEQMDIIAGTAADEALEQLTPPVNLVVWFENQLQ